MTVHAAKGLEFDTVLLTGMENDVFPYKGLDSAEPEELDEERRLAYVAVTRAKCQLMIYHASQRTLFGQTRYLSRSLFLNDLPEEIIKHEASLVDLGHASIDRYAEFEPVRALSTDRWITHRSATLGQALRPGERIVDRSAFDDISESEPQSILRRGQAVFHQRFGRGVVEKIEAGGESATVTANFPGFGRRKILSRYLVAG